MKTGDMIEVSSWIEFTKCYEREFIGIYSEADRYICWNEDKTKIDIWSFGREIDPFRELKECEALGARFEFLYEAEWVDTSKPSWLEYIKYRIKGGITVEQFKANHEKSVPVPVWLITLSDQLAIAALVGRYPTNKLMARGPIHR